MAHGARVARRALRLVRVPLPLDRAASPIRRADRSDGVDNMMTSTLLTDSLLTDSYYFGVHDSFFLLTTIYFLPRTPAGGARCLFQK